MPKAALTPTTPCRSVLATPDGQTAACSLAGATSDSADAALIRSCAALLTMEREWRNADFNDDGSYPDHPVGYRGLIDTVTDTPALTEAGNRAKLAAAVAFYGDEPPNRSIVDELLWDALEALAMPPDKLAQLAAQVGEAQT